MDFDLKAVYERRRARVADYLKANGIAAVIFSDSEERRDISVRYLSGHPSDASLIILQDGRNILVPWDENLAKDRAHADEIVGLESFKRNHVIAARELLSSHNIGRGAVVELSPETPVAQFRKYREELKDFDIRADENGAHKAVEGFRAVKDDYEIYCTRRACEITDGMTRAIFDGVKRGAFKTEADIALFAEKELRAKGCERTSFDTLAAGPARSFAIHAFPGYTNGEWGSQGLSILDYGVCYEGYASDCTITVARGPLSRGQEELIASVEDAARECAELYKPGALISAASRHADEVFARVDRAMPHGLGHGIGLQIHEAPFVSVRAKDDEVFRPGNIVTLEPGLYDKELGGVRLENDVLITESGHEILTHSEIFRL